MISQNVSHSDKFEFCYTKELRSNRSEVCDNFLQKFSFPLFHNTVAYRCSYIYDPVYLKYSVDMFVVMIIRPTTEQIGLSFGFGLSEGVSCSIAMIVTTPWRLAT